MTITNTGSTNAFVDQGPITALVDSSGASYSWSPTVLSDCSPLGSSGMATLAAGSTVTGCIAFAVPSGDYLSEVSIGSTGKTPGVWTLTG